MPRILPGTGRIRQVALAAITVGALVAITGCSATTAPGGSSTSGAVAIPDADGPGVTADTIAISYDTFAFPNSDAATQKESVAAAQALVDVFNEQGGIDGRDVVLVTDDPGTPLLQERDAAYLASGTEVSDASNGQDACEAYADADVFALAFNGLVSAPYGSPAAGACLNAQGQAVIGTSGWSSADFDAAPATAGLQIATDRFYDGLVAAGKDADFFDAPGTTALVTDPLDTTGYVDSVLIPALADEGIDDPAVYPVASDATAAQALSTVVKMKADGITNVVFAASSSDWQVITLLPVMQEQQFVPRMLTVDGANWSLFPLLGTITIDDELTQALASYVSRAPRDGLLLTDTQLATPAGELYQAALDANPTLAASIDIKLADSLELLKAALAASGSEHINAEAFSVGLGKLTDYSSPLLFKTAFSPTAHDGGAGVVRSTYDADCGCAQLGEEIVDF